MGTDVVDSTGISLYNASYIEQMILDLDSRARHVSCLLRTNPTKNIMENTAISNLRRACLPDERLIEALRDLRGGLERNLALGCDVFEAASLKSD
jgi:hypothetical protein